MIEPAQAFLGLAAFATNLAEPVQRDGFTSPIAGVAAQRQRLVGAVDRAVEIARVRGK